VSNAGVALKHIYFTVTNDLTYDQRMHRICTSLAKNGYKVTLVGRKRPRSLPLKEEPYQQKRLTGIFEKGPLFYLEFHIRLLFYLAITRMDGICAIDLDTIIPCFIVSRLRKLVRIYDAHEYFTEMKELRTRPRVLRFWKIIEKHCIPRFPNGYTVSQGLAEQFEKYYHRSYAVIQNFPLLRPLTIPVKREKFLLFQGAVNEARGFEFLIPAMKDIPHKLVICGDGNFMTQLKELIRGNEVTDKVELKGMLTPEQLREIAPQATLGIGLAEKEGINQYYALPNKFTEYMHAGLPQLAMNYPEYKRINDRYRVAVLLDQLSIKNVSDSINMIMRDDSLLEQMHQNALLAREIYCWQQEEIKLLDFYNKLFAVG
jgi:glycosyltransferase involved in cell wall biosynthesis